MQIQNYKQTIVESCLSCCLLQLIQLKNGLELNEHNEQKLLLYALKFTRDDFVAGHLDFIEKTHSIKTTRYIHNNLLYDWAKQFSTTKLQQHKINLKFLDCLLEKSPVCIVLDQHAIFKVFHYPHWILLLEKKNETYLIYEPWDGVVKELSSQDLKKGLRLYLSRLWMAPQAITIE